MNSSEVLTVFFSREYEQSINNKMVFYDYIFPKKEVMDYIVSLVNIPVGDYVSYILSHYIPLSISAKDVFQFSKLTDATDKLCKEVLAVDNPGVTHIDAGLLLQNDGIIRKEGANVKYGENHLKTALMLGLFFELSNTYFLSCVGMLYSFLSSEDKEKLLTRLILRTPLISRLINTSKNGTVNVRQFLYMLSDSTYIRRRSNIRTIFAVLQNSKEYDFSKILDSLIL